MQSATTAAGRKVEGEADAGTTSDSGLVGGRDVPTTGHRCSDALKSACLEVKALRAKMAACEEENEELRAKLTIMSIEKAGKGMEWVKEKVGFWPHITIDMLKEGGFLLDEEGNVEFPVQREVEDKLEKVAEPLVLFTPKRFAAYTRKNKVKLSPAMVFKSEYVFLNKEGPDRMRAKSTTAKVKTAKPVIHIATRSEPAPPTAKPAIPLEQAIPVDISPHGVIRAKLLVMMGRHGLPVGEGGVSMALIQRLRDYEVHVSYKALKDAEAMDMSGLDVNVVLQELLDIYQAEAEIEKGKWSSGGGGQ